MDYIQQYQYFTVGSYYYIFEQWKNEYRKWGINL